MRWARIKAWLGTPSDTRGWYTSFRSIYLFGMAFEIVVLFTWEQDAFGEFFAYVLLCMMTHNFVRTDLDRERFDREQS